MARDGLPGEQLMIHRKEFIALISGVFVLMCMSTALPGASPRTPAQQDPWPQPAIQPIGTPADWLNTDGKPIHIERGKVYVIDFWEYTCVNCLRTLPYLREWNKRYAKYGLVIIGIHTPEFEFARDPKNVAAAVKRLDITWPVLIDSDYKNWNAYRNNFWPREFFVNSRSMIVADHSGEGEYDETEARIQQLVHEIHPTLRFPAVMEPVRDTDKPGAVCYPTTAETYVGMRGKMQHQLGNIDPFEPGQAFPFNDAGLAHRDGMVYAQGLWRTERESLRHARATTDLSDYIALRYHAIECNAVIRPEGGEPIRVKITQDGKPVAQPDKGADIKYDESGASYILVDSPRMYRLTRNAAFGSHEIRLASDSPDFGLYSFTFASCEAR